MPITWGDNPAITIVQDGYTRYINKGDLWEQKATFALDQFANYNVLPIEFGVGVNLTNIEQTFTRPTRPTEPALPSISTSIPGVPALAALVLKTAGDAPIEPNLDSLLTYTAPDSPNSPVPSRPEINVELVPVEVEGRGTITLPVPPTLEQLGVVAFPTINLPTFQGTRPSFSIDVPLDGQLEYQETEYTPALAGAIQAALGSMLQGGSGLPLAVEQAIFDRGRGREDRLSRKQVIEVAEDMAARGFDEPTGVLPSRLREVRGDNREKAAALNRDLAIRIAEIGLENIRSELAQGIAWEQVLISKAEAQNERALRVATYARDYGLRRVDALTAINNLALAAYQADAAVFRDLIAAELSKLQEIDGRIKLEQLKGAVNENLIREYEAQWKGVQALADFYKIDVEAAKVKGEINVQRIQQAELYVRQYSTDVDAWGKLQDAHRTEMEASMAPLRAAELLSGVFANRVNAYRTKSEAAQGENRMQLETNAQTIELGRLGLARAEQVRLAESAAVDAILRRFSGSVGLYQADGSIAQAESASRDRVVQLAVEQNRSAAEIALKGTDLAIQQMLKIGEIMERKLEGLAQVLSQLSSASQAAVNLGAHIGYQGNDATVWTVD